MPVTAVIPAAVIVPTMTMMATTVMAMTLAMMAATVMPLAAMMVPATTTLAAVTMPAVPDLGQERIVQQRHCVGADQRSRGRRKQNRLRAPGTLKGSDI